MLLTNEPYCKVLALSHDRKGFT